MIIKIVLTVMDAATTEVAFYRHNSGPRHYVRSNGSLYNLPHIVSMLKLTVSPLTWGWYAVREVADEGGVA